MRKTGTSAIAKSKAKSRRPEKPKNHENRNPRKNPPGAGKNPPGNPALAGVRPPAPGEAKRGEKGYLGYLLRQAQAATRLTLERALAGLGVTTPQFAVLTMLGPIRVCRAPISPGSRS